MATFNSIEFKEFSTYKEVVIFMIQFLRGQASQLHSSQQIFAAGQPIFEQDTQKLKIGNGVDTYSVLKYIGESSDIVPTASLVNDGVTNWYYDFGDHLRFSQVLVEHPVSSTSVDSANYCFKTYWTENNLENDRNMLIYAIGQNTLRIPFETLYDYGVLPYPVLLTNVAPMTAGVMVWDYYLNAYYEIPSIALSVGGALENLSSLTSVRLRIGVISSDVPITR